MINLCTSGFCYGQQIEKDEPIVNLLCWWAVSGNRYGEHRAIAVAKLLERRNNQVMQGQDGDNTDDKDSVTSVTTGLPVFQPLLMKFLDHDAPILGKKNLLFQFCSLTSAIHYPFTGGGGENMHSCDWSRWRHREPNKFD